MLCLNKDVERLILLSVILLTGCGSGLAAQQGSRCIADLQGSKCGVPIYTGCGETFTYCWAMDPLTCKTGMEKTLLVSGQDYSSWLQPDCKFSP